MAAKKAMARGENFKTPRCRVSFAQQLFKPRSQEEGKPPKYGCTLIFKKEDRPILEKELLKVITAEWGDKGLEMAKNGLIKSPFLAGDGKEARNKETGEIHPGLGPDVFFIRVQANEDRPPVIRYKDPNIPATPEEVFSGCYGNAVVNSFAWHHPTNGNGVSFGIAFFQRTGGTDDDKLGGDGGQVDANKYFEKIEDAGDMPDTTKNGAGAAGLFG